MPASDNPLSPVEVEDASAGSASPAPEPPLSPAEETEQVLEEVAKVAKAVAAGNDPIEAKAKAKAKAKAAKAKAKAKARTAKAKAKAQQRAKRVAARAGIEPIQLITTVPTASPPRAILALPDGKEIVVKPGQMLPSVNLVVLRIDEHSVEISRVELQGTRATVHNQTLGAPK